MWIPTGLSVFRQPPNGGPPPLSIAALPVAMVEPVGLPVEGCLLEDRGPYNRQKLRRDPASGGFEWRNFRRQAGGPISPQSELLWLLDDFGCVVAANWLLGCCWPGDGPPLGLPYLRQMANGIAVEGCRGVAERGVLIVNSLGVSRDSYEMAEASGYDLLLSPEIDASEPAHGLATAISALLAGRLERRRSDRMERVGVALEQRQARRLLEG